MFYYFLFVWLNLASTVSVSNEVLLRLLISLPFNLSRLADSGRTIRECLLLILQLLLGLPI